MNSFDDYIKVEKFYRELETRNIKISETDISINQVLNSNRECLKFANISLTEINWRKYDLKKVYVDRMLALPWIILGSLFILYVCESIPFYFLHNYEFNRTDIQPSNILIYGIPLNVLLLGITYIITISIVIIIRSLSSMLIVRQIEKMSLSEHNNIVYDKDQLGEIFGAYKKKKLFLISLLITGIPTIIIMNQIQEIISTLNYEFSNYSYDLLKVYQITNPLTSYPLTYILLDIGRMTILVWIITKFYSKRLKKIIP